MFGCLDVWMFGCLDVWMFGAPGENQENQKSPQLTEIDMYVSSLDDTDRRQCDQ